MTNLEQQIKELCQSHATFLSSINIEDAGESESKQISLFMFELSKLVFKNKFPEQYTDEIDDFLSNTTEENKELEEKCASMMEEFQSTVDNPESHYEVLLFNIAVNMHQSIVSKFGIAQILGKLDLLISNAAEQFQEIADLTHEQIDAIDSENTDEEQA